MLRSRLLSVLALLFLTLHASAQTRSAAPARRSTNPAVQAVRTAKTVEPIQYGSYARTKLLTQGRGRSTDERRLGAVDRRLLLTTGKSVYKNKPQRRSHR